MMKMKQTLWLSVACALCLSAGQAQAIPIIFNTGVDGSGNVLADGISPDPHYTLISVPTGIPPDTLIRALPGGPLDSYTGALDNTLSRWIGPNYNSFLVGPPGEYVYQTQFDLTGFDPATFSVTGQWITDNDGLKISINGFDIPLTTTGVASFVDGFTFFSIGSGNFNATTNFLNFHVNNATSEANPTALRVEILSAGGAPVPEPTALLLLGSGLVVLAAWRRKYAA